MFHRSIEYLIVRIRFTDTGRLVPIRFQENRTGPKIGKSAVAEATSMSPLATLTIPSASELFVNVV